MLRLNRDSLANFWRLSCAFLVGTVLTIVAWPVAVVWAVLNAWGQIQRQRRLRAERAHQRDLEYRRRMIEAQRTAVTGSPLYAARIDYMKQRRAEIEREMDW